MMVKIPEHISSLKSYRAGRSLEDIQRGKTSARFAKLASNENPLGPSPKALEAITTCASSAHLYPDTQASELAAALSKYHALSADHFACANGSDALLEYLVMAFSQAGDEIVSSEGTFIGLYVIAHKLGRRLNLSPLKDWAYDLEAMQKRVTSKTKIVYLANPNNPTGTYFDRNAWTSFLANIPSDVLVVLDEAYVDYAQSQSDYPQGTDYLQENVVLLRTFSKAYGLAGLRVGYAIARPPIADAIKKVRLPFEPSRLGQVAAVAALNDRVFIEKTLRLNSEMKARLKASLASNGYTYVDSIANFLMLTFPDPEEARVFTDRCGERGLYVRHLESFGLPRGVRINTGTEADTALVEDVLKDLRKVKV